MLSLDVAEKIVTKAVQAAREKSLKPLAIVVLDARGALKCAKIEDGTSLKRPEVATGKAYGALSLGLGSRALAERARKEAHFINAVTHVTGGKLIPAPGGVLILDDTGTTLGAIGISGDASDNDEAVAVIAIEFAGLIPQVGA